MRRALCRRKVGAGERTAVLIVVSTPAQHVSIGACVTRNARILQEEREVCDRVIGFAAQDHR